MVLRANLLVFPLVSSKKEPSSIRFFPETKTSPMGPGGATPSDLWSPPAASPTGTLDREGGLGPHGAWTPLTLSSPKPLLLTH